MIQSNDYVWKIKTICLKKGVAITDEERSTGAAEDDFRNDGERPSTV